MADEVAEDGYVMCEDGRSRPRDECVQCYDDEWRPAEECVEIYNGDWYPQEETVELACGEVASIDDDDVVQRADGEFAWRRHCTAVDGHWYDDEETCSCQRCGDNLLNNDAFFPGDDSGPYCESCHDDCYRSCDCCGDETHRDDMHVTDDDRDLCTSCYENDEPRIILNYSDRSANKLRSESKDRLRFGIELEVESKSDANDGAKWVRGHLADDYCVFKHDGSLGPGGFEIVTRPDSVAVHKRKWESLFADTPGKRLRSWVGGRCGMHVHVSKSALSQLQLGKMLCFLNDPANTGFVASVAGRLPCHWCKVSPKKLSDVKLPAERYVALNITDQTAEFRIFRGTLLGSSFYKNLEFVQAVVEFCSPAARSISDAVSHKAFCGWLSKRDYPNLHAFLVAKGYIREAGRKAG